MPAPIAAAAPTSAIGDLLSGGNPGMQEDAVRQQLEGLAQQVRDIGQMTEAIAVDFPPAAQAVAQIKRLLLQIIQQAGNAAPIATGSDQAVPAGSSMAAGPY